MLKTSFLTVHPAFVASYAQFGVLKGAKDAASLAIEVLNLRDFAVDKHGTIDSPPYGGGDGMVLRCEPLTAAVESLPEKPLLIVPDPSARPFTQVDATRFSKSERPLCFVCGRFSGIDQRFLDLHEHESFSLGDYVVSGGELPALMMLDAIARHLPGALGNAASARDDSFGEGLEGLLEYPLYTRPTTFRGLEVPPILLSGDHAAIAKWRRQKSHERTREKRPDLFTSAPSRGV